MITALDKDRVFVSYLTLRRTIGVLGVSLPILLFGGRLLIGARPALLSSISAYHGTELRDVLVGVLFVIGFFLFSYRGYDRRDNLAGDLACLFALAVAIFPSTSPNSLVRSIHFIAATSLFATLAYFALFLFTKTGRKNRPTPQKRARNRLYAACGAIILTCIIGVAAVMALPAGSIPVSVRPVFWLETLALWAFGVSWFVKGKTILQDRQPGS